jgi:hypothetical protein
LVTKTGVRVLRKAVFQSPQLEEAFVGIGTSIVLLAAGAILRFAITLHTKHVNWDIVGDVLMVAGVAGLVISFIWVSTASRRATSGTTVSERDTREH